MKLIILVCFLCLFAQRSIATDPHGLRKVDGTVNKGQFIDIGTKADERLWIRYCAIADSGVELELTKGSKVVWRAYVEGLRVSHSSYDQSVKVEIDGFDKNKIDVSSVASAGTISETRSLRNGKRLSRQARINPKWHFP